MFSYKIALEKFCKSDAACSLAFTEFSNDLMRLSDSASRTIKQKFSRLAITAATSPLRNFQLDNPLAKRNHKRVKKES